LVVDFITFIREEVGHKCKKCATGPSENFVISFLHLFYSYNNYLLSGIDLLLFAGFNPNKKIDQFGNTSLHVIAKRRTLASHDSAVPVAKLLIEKGFHLNRTNNKGETVFELAKNFPNSALYQYLNQTINPSTSMKSLKFLSARAVSQADFDLVSRTNGTAIPIQLTDFIKCKGKVKLD
jgi:ankyrin repeat protein